MITTNQALTIKQRKKKYLEEYLEVFQDVSVMILKMNHN